MVTMKYLLVGGALVSKALATPSFQSPLYDTGGPATNQSDIVTGIISDPLLVANQEYDYIVAGGGLTGLTVAAKLLRSTKKKFNVLVIESGFYSSEYGPIIDDLNTYGQIFGSSVDHAYETSPQDVNNRVEIVRSGNGLGGSTLINGGTWTRPHKVQLDSWQEVFKMDGWNWHDLLPYMNDIEDPRDPASEHDLTKHSQHYFNATCHNQKPHTGAVKVGARDRKRKWSPMIKGLMDTVTKVTGAPSKKDLCCGDPHGVSMVLNTVESSQVRSDAARSWLAPLLSDSDTKDRITVLTGQLAGKVLLDKTGKDQYRATGVEFGTHNRDDWKFNVTVKEEVILAAGSTISPLILQYSGIGPRDVLREAKIEQKLDLPVGLNLQDQTTTTVVSRATQDGNGQGQAPYFATFKEVFGEDSSRFEALLNDNATLHKWAAETVAAGGFHSKKALFQQYINYQEWLLGDQNVPYAELFFDTDDQIHFDLWNLIPFTRGYVKALDNDPYLRSFEYNPRYFSNELDVYGQAAASKLARDLSRAGSMKQFFGGELIPGPLLREGAGLEAWAQYVKQNFRPNYHGVGTCAMMARGLGGVVNNKAQVYGVDGLRVVDGSIAPTQLSSHVMTVFYGMAAKIAKAIEDDYHKSNL
jgi:choline dehydrogenase-like flavoprotein